MQVSEPNKRSAFIWNVLGSGMNAAATMLLTVITSRLAGLEASGVIGLAFGVCFIFHAIATFEVRAFQSTDRLGRFAFGGYLGVRIICCAAALALCAGYIALQEYESEKALIVFFICLFKIIEAFSDVYHGLFQVLDRLEYVGQSLFWRNVLACVLYTAALLVAGNVVIAALMMPVASVCFLLFFDMKKAAEFESNLRPSAEPQTVRNILLACWPLAASSIMTMYVLNAAKIGIDHHVPQLQGYWTALFMPASFINLFGLFAFRPLLTSLTDQWNGGDTKAFLRSCIRICAAIALMGVAIVLGGSLLGIPVLEVLYGIVLDGRLGVLAVILIGGGFNALSTFLWHVLIVMRAQKCVMLCDLAAFVFAFAAVPLMIAYAGLMGAAMSYLLNTLLRMAVLMCSMLWNVRGRGK